MLYRLNELYPDKTNKNKEYNFCTFLFVIKFCTFCWQQNVKRILCLKMLKMQGKKTAGSTTTKAYVPSSPSSSCYPLSTSRNQVLVQSQCYCQFLVGSSGEPFKNRLLFHRLESQYRARTYVTEYVSCSVSLARQRQTQQTCSRCIAPRRSIGTQHTKAPRERSKSIKSRQLSSRSRSTPMPRTERSA